VLLRHAASSSSGDGSSSGSSPVVSASSPELQVVLVDFGISRPIAHRGQRHTEVCMGMSASISSEYYVDYHPGNIIVIFIYMIILCMYYHQKLSTRTASCVSASAGDGSITRSVLAAGRGRCGWGGWQVIGSPAFMAPEVVRGRCVTVESVS
jgi:serine/threonine protein kinase